MTDLLTPQPAHQGHEREPDGVVPRLIGRISKLEIAVGGAIAVIMLVLIILEPDILEAPFENANTMLFTVGGTLVAAVALVAMLWFRVPPAVRVIVLVVPFAIVNWWLLSPYFIDDVVDEEFSTSISAQAGPGTSPAAAGDEDSTGSASGEAPAESADDTSEAMDDGAAASVPSQAGDSRTGGSAGAGPTTQDAAQPDPASTDESAPVVDDTEPSAPTVPVLLGAGQFVGLAGHFGTGDAGIFQNPDGSYVLRFESFDIQNGPDLEVYLVPGADQTSLADGSIHLGALKGNVGDQNYELPTGTALAPGTYTALVWCEAFSVEFVGATIEL